MTTTTFWILETQRTAYSLGVSPAGRLIHTYWGPKLPYREDYPIPQESREWASFNHPEQLTPEEYPAYGDYKFIDPCLKVTFPDGTRDLVLRFDHAEQDAQQLQIVLKDTHYALNVVLIYQVHPSLDLITRSIRLENQTDAPITVERVFSAQWHVPQGDGYHLSHLTGRWIDEWHLQREPIYQGIKRIESRRLTTSHHHQPWFAIDRGHADEDRGEVWFGVLEWSGNWQIAIESDIFHRTRVNIGVNDWDFALRLASGERYTTPPSTAGYTEHGFGEASRLLHDYIRTEILPHGTIPHQVLYNSWEATLFNVDVQSQGDLAEIAAAMGVELFVMDDGWFHGRSFDHAGLGDWWPNHTKFPDGLAPLIERVNGLGMDFGLWVEPEMVNPDSDLYRAHPDWVIHFPSRDRTEARNQLILNFARLDVQEYILDQMDRLLRDHRIAFIKWDMNRNVSQPGWQTEEHDPREIWIRYVEGVYRVWGILRERHPQVIWQSCSGGGGRADLGILRYADQIWVSDNTEAAARLGIQWGFSQVFPANTMEAWVTDWNQRQLSLTFRFHVSMCGALGIGGHLINWSKSDRDLAARLIALYKAIRPVVQLGDQYRLLRQTGFYAVQYLGKDRQNGVLFLFRTHAPHPTETPRLYLRGLDPNARYQIEGFDQIRSGLAWMRDGLQADLSDDFSSAVYRITRVNG
ncbi:MAG: alpha-galactosidase [Anaerolineae bacterium]|nr:alpha-galactosidase [Anaerolineae bacterium]